MSVMILPGNGIFDYYVKKDIKRYCSFSIKQRAAMKYSNSTTQSQPSQLLITPNDSPSLSLSPLSLPRRTDTTHLLSIRSAWNVTGSSQHLIFKIAFAPTPICNGKYASNEKSQVKTRNNPRPFAPSHLSRCTKTFTVRAWEFCSFNGHEIKREKRQASYDFG